MLLVFALCSTILSAQTGAQSPDLIAQEALNASYADALNEIGRINRPNYLPISFSSDLADVNLKIYSADKPYNLPYENPKIHVAGAPYLIRNISLQEPINLVAGTYYVLASKSGYLDHIQVFEVPAPAAIPIFLYPEGIVSILKTKKKVLSPNTLKLSRIDSTGNLLSWTIAEPQYRYIIDRSENGADWQNGLISFSSGVRQWKDPDGKPVQYYRIYGVKDDRISLPLMASLSQTALNASYADTLNAMCRIEVLEQFPVNFSSDLSDVNLKIYPADNPDHIVEATLGNSINLAAGTYYALASKNGYLDHIQEFKVPATAAIPISLCPEGFIAELMTKGNLSGPSGFAMQKAVPTGNQLSWTDTGTQCKYVIDKKENGADWHNGLITFSSGIERWTDIDGKGGDIYRIHRFEYNMISMPSFATYTRTISKKDAAFPDPPKKDFGPWDDFPVMIGEILPEYPDLARQNRIQGTVIVEAYILKDGTVWAVEVRRSLPGLDAAAVDAVRKVRFMPATRGGKAADVTLIIPVEFSLD